MGRRMAPAVALLVLLGWMGCDRMGYPTQPMPERIRRALPAANHVIDLGTLGNGPSRAYAVNDMGQVVGLSLTASGETHAFLWDGVMTDLGTLGGGFSIAWGINDDGQVVGQSLTPSGEMHAFLWDGGMTDLGTLGGSGSVARDINDAGQVVGTSRTASGETHVFLWEGGLMTDLGDLGSVWAINDAGQIVGRRAGHAFLWDNGSLMDLGTLGFDPSEALDINDFGKVVGVSRIASGSEHAFFWDDAITDLGPLGGDFTETFALGVNDGDLVVGFAANLQFAVTRAFLWNGTMTDLGSLSGGSAQAEAWDINNAGQVVGSSSAASGEHATMWVLGAEFMAGSTIVELQSSVEELVQAGDLSAQDAQPILAGLENVHGLLQGNQSVSGLVAAAASPRESNLVAAIQVLESVANKIHALVESNRIDNALADDLLSHIAIAIDLIEQLL